MYNVQIMLVPHYQKGKIQLRVRVNGMHPQVPRVDYDFSVNVPASGQLSSGTIKKHSAEAAVAIAENFTYMLRDYYDRRDLPRALSSADWYFNRISDRSPEGSFDDVSPSTEVYAAQSLAKMDSKVKINYQRATMAKLYGQLSSTPEWAPPNIRTCDAQDRR